MWYRLIFCVSILATSNAALMRIKAAHELWGHLPVSQFDITAPKKVTNLSINADLLRQAKELNINLSQTLERHLAELVREAWRQQWLDENNSKIIECNQMVDSIGVFGDGIRQF